MPDDAPPPKGLSRVAWGAITAITVVAIIGIVTLTMRAGEPSNGVGGATSSGPVTADAIAGRWAGTARTLGDTATFRIEVEIAPGCGPGARCGIIGTSSLPCFGSLYLYTIDLDDYEFRVADFTRSSGKGCQSGTGEHLRPLPDSTLQYTTNVGTRGILRRQ